MSARLKILRKQFDDANAGLDAIEAAADAAGGELTDEQQAESDTLMQRAEELGKEIEPLAKRQESIDAAAKVLSKLQNRSGNAGPGQTAIARAAAGTAEAPKMEAGEYFSLFARVQEGDDDARREVIARAVADQTTGDVSPLLPVQVVGDLLKLADSSRPVFSSFRSLPMPLKSKTFERPIITQRVQIAEQLAEKAEVASRKMILDSSPVTKRTFAGVLDLSEQSIDWTDPALLQIVLEDFVDVYAEVSEGEAVEALVALATADDPWVGTDPGTVVGSIATGVQSVYTSAKRMPDTMWLSLDAALTLASTTNSIDSITAMTLIRQALSDVGISLNFVVGPQLPPDTRILGASSLVESYEQRKGLLQAVNVAHLGLDVAYRAYLAFFGRAAGFVNLAEA